MTDSIQPADSDRQVLPSWVADRRRLYSTLLDEGLDAEALHQLLVEKGPALLDSSVPYLVVAARNRARSTDRRDRRGAELHELHAAEQARQASATLDPADIVVARVELSAAVAALGQLDPRYSWPLWWHAAGFDDEEIRVLWNEAGFKPADPTAASIRKRRERARGQLRRLLGKT